MNYRGNKGKKTQMKTILSVATARSVTIINSVAELGLQK